MDSLHNRAIAYLKAEIESSEKDELVVELAGPDAPVGTPLVGGLIVHYVIDEGDSFTFVQRRHLDESGLHQDQLHGQAIANLAACVDEIRVQPHRSVFGLLCGGNFEASLMLLDHLWDVPLMQYVEGGIVVAVPARDVLAFGDVSSYEAIRDLKDLVAQVWADGDHLVSRHLFCRVDGRWERYDA